MIQSLVLNYWDTKQRDMRRRHAVSPVFTGHYQGLGISSLKRVWFCLQFYARTRQALFHRVRSKVLCAEVMTCASRVPPWVRQGSDRNAGFKLLNSYCACERWRPTIGLSAPNDKHSAVRGRNFARGLSGNQFSPLS